MPELGRGRKRRIDVWSHFTYDNRDNKTVCRPCGAKIAGKNTTNLKRHLQATHPEIHAKIKKRSDDKDDHGPGGNEAGAASATQQQATSAFLRSSKYKTEPKEQQTEEQNTTMFNLKDFVNQRLSAAAMEIFEEFEKMLDVYKAEVTRSKEEVDNLRNQLDLLHDKSAAEAPAAHSTIIADGCDSILLLEKLLPSTPVEMGQDSDFSVKAEAAGPSHTNAGVENPDWINGMLHSDPEVSQVKEEQEELGIDSQKQEAVFLSADVVKSEQDQPEAEFEYELQPLSSDCSAAQSENSDDEDWTESKGAQKRPKKRKAKSKQRQTDSSTQEGYEVLPHEESSAKSQSDDHISCHLCGKTFKYIGFLMNHIKTHDKTVDCHVCEITFQSAEELIKHLQSAIKKRHFCDLCGKTFTKMHLLKEHSKIHTGTKEFTCQDCGKAFLRKTELTVHTRAHSGEKPYSCDICGKAFSQRNNLKSHRRCHTGEKPHYCEVCGYSFRTSNHLKTHMRHHSGEKPYSCDICGKTFCQTGELTRHMMTHTEERPYGCHVCGMRYKFDSNLKVHMRNHKEEAT
ncbi:zinc finger protein 1 homolog isoform X1 [Myripristis murdjan]|uniref:zinc finger protein 1 homolog isoform X1 n=1 Tax=Myripristis murdjan TaxID=586833 RepID=UPI0011762AC5|nr:zinc finger protein 1 homolog isoform X1 [Myripristis murdjan]